MRSFTRIASLTVISLYFLISLVTLHQYGTNWDEPEHLMRGQAYLHFFLTGREHYDQRLFEEGNRHSFYQIPQYDFAKWKEIDAGHPVFSDIISSLFNHIFYQQLGIIGDFDSYHLYGPVLVTFFLVFLYFWVERYFGEIAALISVISIITYPLFYGESHYNVQKDIPQTIFYSSAILTFFIGYTRKSSKWIILSALFFGFGWGTKFNILFMPLILLFWLIVKERLQILGNLWRVSKRLKFSLLSYPIIGFSVFFFSWPFLWSDSIQHVLEIFGYYKGFGVATKQSLPSEYYLFGFNFFPIQWIIFATPLITLFLSAIGMFYILTKGFKEKDKVSFLILFWFLLPILRVSMPNTSIYGGIRQIMEYIPAMAILAGIGGQFLIIGARNDIIRITESLSNYKRKIIPKKQICLLFFLLIVLISLYIPVIYRIILLHPNESVYFNTLIGGMKGAQERNLPGWGNSLGSTYRQGVNWINEHGEKNSKVALVHELVSNIPQSLFREDILYSNTYRSGPKREGEYIIGVTHYGAYENFYHRKYLERFLIPVYEVKVDGVSVLKVWKNDLTHTRPGFRGMEKEIQNVSIKKENEDLRMVIEFPYIVKLTRIVIDYKHENCTIPLRGVVRTSKNNQQWTSLPGSFNEFVGFSWFRPDLEKNKLQYIFAADEVKFIRLSKNTLDSCLLIHPIKIRAWMI